MDNVLGLFEMPYPLLEEEEEANSEECLENLMTELVDEVTLGLCFEVHRACKLGKFMLDDTDLESQSQYEIVDKKGLDVFGQVPMKKQLECICPNCQRNLAASRFAPHLEKCMGMGRNSSRIASRRMRTKKTTKESENESEGEDDDFDWSYLADKRAKKLKKEKSNNNSPRRGKSKVAKNGDKEIVNVDSPVSGTSSIPSMMPYETMTIDERRELLTHTCGVISEHTKKMCTRSIRCPQHTDEQRRAVRLYVLAGQQGSLEADDIQVDIDTYDDAETQSLRDTLHWEAISNPSPADSTSTTNSNGSRRRKSQKKNSKSKSSRDGVSTPNSLFEFS